MPGFCAGFTLAQLPRASRKTAYNAETGLTIGLQVQSARPRRAAILPISPGSPLRWLAMEIRRVVSRPCLHESLLSPRIPLTSVIQAPFLYFAKTLTGRQCATAQAWPVPPPLVPAPVDEPAPAPPAPPAPPPPPPWAKALVETARTNATPIASTLPLLTICIGLL
jgi:hypothetical protein